MVRREIRATCNIYPFDSRVIPKGAHGEFMGFTRDPNKVKVKFESGKICFVIIGENAEVVDDEIRAAIARRSKPAVADEEDFD